MAGKRTAASELNHDNWNDDEEPEERGTYKRASEAELSRRIIKTARRRNPISSVRGDDDGKKSAFVGFTGFQNKPAATQNFSFLNNLTKPQETIKTNGISTTDSNKTTTSNSLLNFNKSSSDNKAETKNTPSIFNSTNVHNSASITSFSDKSSSSSTKKSEEFYAKLKGLNESVSKWISRKVEDNPLISLTPIFKDYEKYLDELETEEQSKASTKTTLLSSNTETNLPTTFNFKPVKTMPVPDSTSEKNAASSSEAEKKTVEPKFSFGAPSTASSGVFSIGGSGNLASNAFSFGQSTTTQSTNTFAAPTFSFGSNSSTSSSTSFLSSAPQFSFSAAPKTDAKPKDDTENTEENDDEPPKVEFTPVVEKDHVYTARCKVFVKKNDAFTDRGVGNIFLKPIENSEKYQLIVRADTNLGNLLLNFILSEAIPTQRMGKKDVMLVCLPMPDSQPPPVPILLRVKSEDEANKLLETLEKYKK